MRFPAERYVPRNSVASVAVNACGLTIACLLGLREGSVTTRFRSEPRTVLAADRFSKEPAADLDGKVRVIARAA